MRRALCHRHFQSDADKRRTINAQSTFISTILVHLWCGHGFNAMARLPLRQFVLIRLQKLKRDILLAAIQSAGALVLALLGAGTAYPQAPIRERSDAVSAIDGARRAADLARNGLVAADARRNEATARVKKAEEGLLAAQKEIEASRIEKAAADRAQEAARAADDLARAALVRALDARK